MSDDEQQIISSEDVGELVLGPAPSEEIVDPRPQCAYTELGRNPEGVEEVFCCLRREGHQEDHKFHESKQR